MEKLECLIVYYSLLSVLFSAPLCGPTLRFCVFIGAIVRRDLESCYQSNLFTRQTYTQADRTEVAAHICVVQFHAQLATSSHELEVKRVGTTGNHIVYIGHVPRVYLHNWVMSSLFIVTVTLWFQHILLCFCGNTYVLLGYVHVTMAVGEPFSLCCQQIVD